MSQTHHSAVGHGALGFAGTFGALSPLWVSVGRFADLEDVPGGSGAVLAPIRCRTHAYTYTNKTALIQNVVYLPKTPPQYLALVSYIVSSVTRQFGKDTTKRIPTGICYKGYSLLSIIPLFPSMYLRILFTAATYISILESNTRRAEEPDERSRILSALPRLQRGRESPSLQQTVAYTIQP